MRAEIQGQLMQCRERLEGIAREAIMVHQRMNAIQSKAAELAEGQAPAALTGAIEALALACADIEATPQVAQQAQAEIDEVMQSI